MSWGIAFKNLIKPDIGIGCHAVATGRGVSVSSDLLDRETLLRTSLDKEPPCGVYGK